MKFGKGLEYKIINFLYISLLFWLIASLVLLLAADRLIFQNQHSQGPIKSSIDYNEVFVAYDEVHKIYITESFLNESDPLVVVFFHGNAGGVGRIINTIAPHYNVVAPSYPGYHMSTGTPSEEGIYKTVDLTMSHLARKGIKQENIIVFGASLGGLPALYAAKNYPNIRNVIIVGTFDRIKSVCSEMYYIFCSFTDSIFNNIELAKGVKKVNVSHFHSIDDEIIDFDMGDNLFKHIASKNKKFYKINGGHNEFDAIEIIRTSILQKKQD